MRWGDGKKSQEISQQKAAFRGNEGACGCPGGGKGGLTLHPLLPFQVLAAFLC